MATLEAGFGRMEITPDNLGFPLMGYGNRKSNSTGVHDSLWAKALVLRQGDVACALCSVDLCFVDAKTVSGIRQLVSERTGLTSSAIIVVATHTHSAPSPLDAGNWDRSFAEIVAEAVVRGWENLQSARLAHGAGFLYGYSINRRWFERPIDPAVGVLRLDDANGNMLGLVTNFACHPVVLGYDNYLVSADYVGYAMSELEERLVDTCIFTNGGCADVNPLTEVVRRQISEGYPFITMSRDGHYYGEGENAISIEDRGGGTFGEAEIIGHALADEVIRVTRGLVPRDLKEELRSVQAWINRLAEGEELVETQALTMDDFAIVTQPGEVFVESALDVKAELRKRGYVYPWLVSYANDWQSYLVPESAWPEGGYEVGHASERKHSPKVQERLQARIFKSMDAV